jgi:HD-like signal output (HDOD) protein/signal transduction histidine kinase
LPTLPAVAVQLLQLTGSQSSTTGDIVRLIESDPALTTRIMKLVHRADLGAGSGVQTVERAVILLGLEAVRNAVLAVSVFEVFQSVGPASTTFNRNDFWKHCIAVACCCELLAGSMVAKRGRACGVDPSEAFICGLLHDMGKVALDAALPKSFARVVEAAELLRGNIADLERTVIGLDHMVVGKRLAERWELPSNVRDCIWLHGQLPAALPTTVANARLVNLTTLSDVLVREQHLGYSGNHLFPIQRQTLIDALGLTNQQIDEVLAQLVEKLELRCAGLGLGQASTAELYQQAIVRANQELGQVSTQLAARNRKLAIRAKFFDALSGFQSEMHPDAPPSEVLDAIGQTAIAVLDVGTAAIFSLPPGCDFAETVLVDSAGLVFEKSVVETGPGLSLVPDLIAPDHGDAPPGPTAQDQHQDQSSSALPPGPEAPTPEPPPPEARLPEAPAPAPSGPLPQVQVSLGPVLPSPVLPVGRELEWLLAAISPRLGHSHRYWISLKADGRCIGGVIWGAPLGEVQRLGAQAPELTAMAGGWSLALRTAQIREDSRALSEQLAEANRRLQNAQSELLRSKMLVVVGEMAAGAAHEMNNPLAVISGRSQLLASQLKDPKLKSAALLIFEQSHRLSQIITELMDFACPTKAAVENCEVARIVEQAVTEAKAGTDSADRTISVTVGDVPAVTVDPKQVAAALAEVVANALQATDPHEAASGSPPRIETENSGAAFGHVSIYVAFDPYSQRVVLSVADDGCGMDQQTARCAFDPFFSAKPAGRRRGMGLAKALRWVEGSGGSIRLESRLGKGTRAVILLPAARPSPPEAAGEAVRRQA